MKRPGETAGSGFPVPWATALVALLALALHFAPAAETRWALDRALTLRGELWRLWTGHLVHFGASHLLWDVVAVVVAGGWAERVAAAHTRTFYLLAPPIVALALLAALPGMSVYGGLSGVGVGVIALLAANRLRAPGTRRGLWWMALALLALRIGLESAGSLGTFARFSATEVRAVPLAHFFGALCGAVIGSYGRRARPARQSDSANRRRAVP